MRLLSTHSEFENAMWPLSHESIQRKAESLINDHMRERAAPLPGSDEAELRRLAANANELREQAKAVADDHLAEKAKRDAKKAETEGGREIRERFVQRFGSGGSAAAGSADLRRSSAPPKRYTREEYESEVGDEWAASLDRPEPMIHPKWIRVPGAVGAPEYFELKPEPVPRAGGRVANLRDGLGSLVQLKMLQAQQESSPEAQAERKEERMRALREESQRRADERDRREEERERREEERKRREEERAEERQRREEERAEERARREEEREERKEQLLLQQQQQQMMMQQMQAQQAMFMAMLQKPPQPPQ